MYYQMNILSSKSLYDQVLPERKGFESFEKAIKTNPIHFREEDQKFYVKISKEDGIMVRRLEKMPWIFQMAQTRLQQKSKKNEMADMSSVLN